MEHQKVATVDIPGAFMQADMEGETVNTKIERKMAELLTKLHPKLYSQIRDEQKMENGHLCGEKESPVWHAPGSAPVLAKCNIKPTGVGV